MKRAEPQDLQVLFGYYQDPDYAEFFRRLPTNMNMQEFLQIEMMVRGTFYVCDGGFACITEIDPYAQSAQIGFLVDKSLWKQKVGFKITKEFIDHLFTNTQLRKVQMRFLANRQDIERYLQTSGFHREGYYHESVYFQGRYVDELEYAILKPKFYEVFPCHS